MCLIFKLLICQSKILTKFVKAKGIAIKIIGRMEEDEFIGKLKQLPGVWSLNSEERLLMSDRVLKVVGSNCKDLKSLEFGNLFANVQLISQETLLKTLRNLRKLKRLKFSIQILCQGKCNRNSNFRIIQQISLSECPKKCPTNTFGALGLKESF